MNAPKRSNWDHYGIGDRSETRGILLRLKRLRRFNQSLKRYESDTKPTVDTDIGWFQTLFLWILKSLDIEISIESSDSQWKNESEIKKY